MQSFRMGIIFSFILVNCSFAQQHEGDAGTQADATKRATELSSSLRDIVKQTSSKAEKLRAELKKIEQQTEVGREVITKYALIEEARVAHAKQFNELRLECDRLRDALKKEQKFPGISESAEAQLQESIVECEADVRKFRASVVSYKVAYEELEENITRVNKELSLFAKQSSAIASQIKIREVAENLKKTMDETSEVFKKYNSNVK